ncbi:response regulator [Lentibacillus saliphilus]|uniref:response regulator n=1 Tax=Lentibacillus saliphilus TaxID=2737028 RepID=UPI001C301C6E|nr:response regulator [Lentibacillus saliphilus]
MKLLIVEDERIVRKGILTSMNWEQYGIEDVAEAKNGKVALDIIRELKPDIVMTDIRMPVMDGLQLAENIHHDYPDMHIVILSGYEDFAYAQQAIKLGVSEYLIKPVGREELERVILSIKQTIDQKVALNNKQQQISQIYEANLNVISEQWLNAIISQEKEFNETNKTYAAQIGLQFTGPYYQLLLIEIDDYQIMETNMSSQQLTRIKNDVFQRVQVHFPTGARRPIIWKRNRCHIGIIFNINTSETAHVLEQAQALQANMCIETEITVTIGLSSVFDKIEELAFAVLQAERALNKKKYSGKNAIYKYDTSLCDSLNTMPSYDQFDWDKMTRNETDFIQHVRSLDTKRATAALQDVFVAFSNNKMALQWVKNWALKVIFMMDQELKFNRHMIQDDQSIEIIKTSDTIHDVQALMEQQLINMIETVESARKNSKNHVITRAIHYIEAHYQEPLTLDHLAKYSFVSPSHFSKLFKKETGQTFIEWLNIYRVKQAKKLFTDNPAMPIYKVAEEVGFLDYKYFVRVFKRYSNMTPTAFKAHTQPKIK